MEKNYHFVFTIQPHAPTTRQLLAKIELPMGRAPSYMHSMAATSNYVVLIAEPLFMRMTSIMAGVPLVRLGPEARASGWGWRLGLGLGLGLGPG